jgi:hypothetical protein
MLLALGCENPTKKKGKKKDFSTYLHINLLIGSIVHWKEREEFLAVLI